MLVLVYSLHCTDQERKGPFILLFLYRVCTSICVVMIVTDAECQGYDRISFSHESTELSEKYFSQGDVLGDGVASLTPFLDLLTGLACPPSRGLSHS